MLASCLINCLLFILTCALTIILMNIIVTVHAYFNNDTNKYVQHVLI